VSFSHALQHDRGDLPERSGKEENDRNRGKCDACAHPIGREGSRHAPDGLCDDRDRDELEAVQETFGNRPGRAIRAGRMTVTGRSGFAVGGVAAIKELCLSDPKRHRIRIIHEEADDNPAHTALRGWPRDNDDLLELLAEEAWADIVLNAVIAP
jgi:hypothetical protein